MNAVMVMAFDGDTQLERPLFETTEEAWDYANDLGSKWYFYPFCFVVSESGKTIKDACGPLRVFIGKQVKTVKRVFAECAANPDNEGLDAEQFSFEVYQSA